MQEKKTLAKVGPLGLLRQVTIAAGASAIAIKRRVDRASRPAVAALRAQSRSVQSAREKEQVTTISRTPIGQNAVSAASVLLPIDMTMTELPEPKPAPPAIDAT